MPCHCAVVPAAKQDSGLLEHIYWYKSHMTTTTTTTPTTPTPTPTPTTTTPTPTPTPTPTTSRTSLLFHASYDVDVTLAP